MEEHLTKKIQECENELKAKFSPINFFLLMSLYFHAELFDKILSAIKARREEIIEYTKMASSFCEEIMKEGQNSLMMGQYEEALNFFQFAKKVCLILDARDVLESNRSYYNYTSGIQMIKENKLDEAVAKFATVNKTALSHVESNFIESFTDVICIDNCIRDLPYSKSLVEAKEKISDIEKVIERYLIKEGAIIKEISYYSDNLYEIFGSNPFYIIIAKALAIDALSVTLNFQEYQRESLNFARDILGELGFSKSLEALNAIDNFINAFKEETIKKDYNDLSLFSASVQRELLKMLKPFYVMDGELTSFVLKEKKDIAIAERIENRIQGFLKKKLPEFARKEQKKVKEPEEEKVEYEVWESKKGWRSATLGNTKSIKKDKTVRLLLDESGRIYVKGEDKTDFFKRKRVSYPLLKYFLENRGSAFLTDIFEELKKIKGKPISKKTYKRRIRNLSSLLNKLSIKEKIFFIGKDRAYIPSEVRIGFIRKKATNKSEDYLQ